MDRGWTEKVAIPAAYSDYLNCYRKKWSILAVTSDFVNTEEFVPHTPAETTKFSGIKIILNPSQDLELSSY